MFITDKTGKTYFPSLIYVIYGKNLFIFNPFHTTGLFRYPLKTSENQSFSDVFRDYPKRPVAWNKLIATKQKKRPAVGNKCLRRVSTVISSRLIWQTSIFKSKEMLLSEKVSANLNRMAACLLVQTGGYLLSTRDRSFMFRIIWNKQFCPNQPRYFFYSLNL